MQSEGLMTNLKNDITTGNLIQISLLIIAMVWGWAVMQSDINTNKEGIQNNSNNIIELRDYMRNTYVRKDVQEQIMRRLDNLQVSQNRIENKVDRLPNEK